MGDAPDPRATPIDYLAERLRGCAELEETNVAGVMRDAADKLKYQQATISEQSKEIERLQKELAELDADLTEACMPDEKDV